LKIFHDFYLYFFAPENGVQNVSIFQELFLIVIYKNKLSDLNGSLKDLKNMF